MRHQQPGLQAIMSQRRSMENSTIYTNASNVDQKLRFREEFEQISANKYKTEEAKRRAIKLQTEYARQIDARRRKLSLLLQKEDQELEYELKSANETPMQRRKRLQQRLHDLQLREEEVRKEDVDRRLYMRWREECDPLRKQLSQQFERQIIKERDQQVAELAIRKMEEGADEAIWARRDKEAAEEFRRRQSEEQEEFRRKQELNAEIWSRQMEDRRRRDYEAQRIEYERGMEFRRRNDEEVEKARQASIQKANEQAARRHELDVMNQDLIRRKRTALEDERRLDMQMAAAAQEALRKEQEDQLVQKLVANKRARMNRELLESQINRKRIADSEADRYIEAVQEERNQKEDEARRLDAERRRRLMMDAHSYQEQQMAMKDQQKREAQIAKEQEKVQLAQDIAMKKQREQEERDAIALKVRNQYEMLRQQSIEKARREALEKQREEAEARATVQAWKDEERRIQEELKNPRYQVGARFRGYH